MTVDDMSKTASDKIKTTATPHLEHWTIDPLAMVAVVGLAAKSAYVAIASVGVDGALSIVGVALWAGLYFAVVVRAGRGVRSVATIITALLLSVVLWVDLVHLRAFGSVVNYAALGSGLTLDDLGPSIAALVAPWDVLLLLDVFVLVMLASRRPYPRGLRLAKPRKGLGRLGVALACAFALLSLFQLPRVPVDQDARMLFGGPLGLHLNQVTMLTLPSTDDLTESERQDVQAWFTANREHAAAVPPDGKHAGVLSGKNVYLVVVESLESMVLDLEVDDQEITPRINALMDEGLVFTDIAQQVREGTTSDGELLILTSMYPLDSGSAFLRYPYAAYGVTLPKLLRQISYSAVALHGDAASFWNRDVVFPRLGWSDYVSQEDFEHAPESGLGVLDGALFDQALIEIGRESSPHLMMLSTITSHIPWRLPDDLQGLELSKDDISSDYLQALHYTDAQLGRFYDELGRRGLLDRAAFVIVGDHEGIHRYRSKDTWLPDNDMRIPFIVHVPGMEQQIIDTPGGQVDILPTLAYLLGIPAEDYADGVMGRNLFGADGGSAIDSQGHVRAAVGNVQLLENAVRVSGMTLRGGYFAGTEHDTTVLSQER
ncbi:MAG: hypothetical protein DCC50_06785 [Acidobacteria bacterium]|nr:MAG: hypothetical protein DCC50_06785 [Acidobacteriota bacterium]